ncbi:MAG: class I SAM-dependent methyltransferase [Pseudomonadota bacterium]
MSDTFSRSLLHWSDEKRRGMEDFYALATADYGHLARALDWKAQFEALQAQTPDEGLSLLDVACGSGKFPAALMAHGNMGAAAIHPVAYALLDPSAFSIREARRILEPPFVPADTFKTTLQDFDPPQRYDVVWATHALYAVPPDEIAAAMAKFVAAVGRFGFIAHAAAEAHYIKFYDLFLADRPGGVPYTRADAIVNALEGQGISVSTRDISYVSEAPLAASDTVEGYLQRCVFDDTVSLDDLLAGAATGPYLEACRAEGAWRFAQTVTLITLTR